MPDTTYSVSCIRFVDDSGLSMTGCKLSNGLRGLAGIPIAPNGCALTWPGSGKAKLATLKLPSVSAASWRPNDRPLLVTFISIR